MAGGGGQAAMTSRADHATTRSWPPGVSTRAVQLSTQSPQLI